MSDHRCLLCSVVDCDIEDVDWLCVTGLFVGVVYDDADDDDDDDTVS